MEILPGGKNVQRGDIPEYFDDVFHLAYKEWQRWKRFGLSDWRDQREIVIRFIEIFDEEVSKWQEAEIKNDNRRAKGSR